MFACNGILFNHESEYRGEEFVTRKITKNVARIKCALERADTDIPKLKLGTLTAKRDWGHAGEYCVAMQLMLQHDHPDDYVIATGVSHTVEDFVREAFAVAGLDWEEWTEQDPRFVRPCEVPELRGDASKAREQLGWEPTVDFQSLIVGMVNADYSLEKGNTNG
jgi:GDPmannose 4,6-dehydratase